MPELSPQVKTAQMERNCPRCGRPVERGPSARWCSASCKSRFYLERRLAAVSENLRDVVPEEVGPQEGMSDYRSASRGPQRPVISTPPGILETIRETQAALMQAKIPYRADYEDARRHAIDALDALAALVELHQEGAA
jgi:hypothetical protein